MEFSLPRYIATLTSPLSTSSNPFAFWSITTAARRSRCSTRLKTNIRSITVTSEDGMFEGTIVLYVNDVKQLRRIMKRLGRLDGIYGVYRDE